MTEKKKLNKELFKKLSQVKETIKKFEQFEKDLQGQIIFEMKDFDVERVKSEFGTFSLMNRTTYSYPSEIKDKIKKLQAKAVLDGVANKTETEILRFQAKKEDETL